MRNGSNLKTQLERAKAELNRLYLVGNAMQSSLKLDEILFIILTSVTAEEGLGFNRAMLFLKNDEKNILEGKMGIGPQTNEEAEKIWRQIDQEKLSFEDLIGTYKIFYKNRPTTLNSIVKKIKIPLREEYCVIAMTALEGMPFEVITPEAMAKVNPEVKKMLKLKEFVTVPLKAKEKIVGVLLADNRFDTKPILKDDIKILSMFANQAGLAIENSILYEQKEKMSQTDPLTGLYNHGHFQYLLGREIKRSNRYNHPLSLIMLDMDHFKVYNDKFGHPAGDALLKTISRLILDVLRENDIAARYGGEEFAIILPQTSKDNALKIAEKIRNKIENFSFENKKVLPGGHLTVSLGIAAFPDDTRDKHSLIQSADQLMYKAKAAGRNRVCAN